MLSLKFRTAGKSETEFVPSNPLNYLRDADCLACFADTDVVSRGIEIASGGPYYHCSTAYFAHSGHRSKQPMVVEQWQGTGGRIIPWAEWISGRPDSIDVYRPDAGGYLKYDHAGCIKWLLDNIPGRDYDWATIRRIAREHSWLWGWFCKPCYDEDAPPPRGYVCSTAAAAGAKYGGKVHPVARMWVGDIFPSMLVQGRLFTYIMTIHTHPAKV